jgi:hypothetical protein
MVPAPLRLSQSLKNLTELVGLISINSLFMSLPRALDTGGENLYIDTQDVQKLLIVGDSAVRLLITLGVRSAW